MNLMNNKLYIFDFDGTISTRDSFISFSYFSFSFYSFIMYWVSVIYFYTFRSKSDLKHMFYSNFKEFNFDDFNRLCEDFNNLKLKKLIKKSFLEYIKNIETNSEIVIVSASISNYLKIWCKSMNFKLISTELEVKDDKLTGKFSTPNCNGKEKAIRIKEEYNLTEYHEIHVFGNSKGDLPMLELGTHKYFNFFN